MDHQTATITSSTFNLANTILGAGMLAMPAAMAACGILTGLIALVSAGILGGLGFYLYTLSALRVPQGFASFNSLSNLTYPYLSPVFDIAITVNSFGVSISYLIIIGSTMPTIVAAFLSAHQGTLHEATTELPDILSERTIWITLAIILVIPIAFQRRLDALKYTSFFALLCVLYVATLVVYFFFHQDQLHRVQVRDDKQIQGPFSAIPIFVFAYTCHQNVFSIYNELKRHSQARMNKIIVLSVGLAMFLYATVGCLGYIMFGDEISSDAIEMLPNAPIVTVGRLGLALLIVFSYPLQIHPARASLDKLLFGSGARSAHNKVPEYDKDTKHLADPQPLRDSHFEEAFGSADTNVGDRCLRPRVDYADENGDQIERVMTSTEASDACEAPKAGGHGVRLGFRNRGSQMHNTRCSLLTSILVFGGYLIALALDSLDTVLGFVGATGSTTITFILPGLFYWKLHAGATDNRTRFLRVLSVLLMVLGLVVFVASIAWRIYSLVADVEVG